MVRYIHSGDRVESKKEQSAASAHPGGERDPVKNEAAPEAGTGGEGKGQQGQQHVAEYSASAGGGDEGQRGQGQEQEQAQSQGQGQGQEQGQGYQAESSASVTGGGSAAEKRNDGRSGEAEAADELGVLLAGGQTVPEGEQYPVSGAGERNGAGPHDGQQGSASPGEGPVSGTKQNGSTDIGGDAGNTAFGGHDLQASESAGVPDQEGAKSERKTEPAVSGSSYTEASVTQSGQSALPQGTGEPQQALRDDAASQGIAAPQAIRDAAASQGTAEPQASRDDAASQGTAEPQASRDDAASQGTADPQASRDDAASQGTAAPQASRDDAASQGTAAPQASGNGEPAGSAQAGGDADGGMKGFLATLFGSDSASGDSSQSSGSGAQDTEASAELGTGSQEKADSASSGGSAADAQTDIGVDAGMTGYSGHDLQASDGAGTPDQEGSAAQQKAEPAVQGSSDTEAGLPAGQGGEPAAKQDSSGDDPAVQSASGAEAQNGGGDAAAQNNASGGGQPQDTEVSGELGTEEQDSGRKGFWARLFGDDPESEEDETSDEQGMNAGGQGDKQQAPGGGQQATEEPSGQAQADLQPRRSKKNKQQAKAPDKKHADPLQEKRDAERSDSLEQSIIYWQGNDKIPEHLEDTKKTLTEVLGLGSSFDIVFREMSFAGRKAALLCISGFAKDNIVDEILKRLTYLTPDKVSADVLVTFMNEYIPHLQVEQGELLSETVNKVLTGMSVFFIEGEQKVIIMDTRTYPSRNPDEPSIERVVRGARDGFTETLLSNVSLVRRRIRDPGLKYEMHQVGRRTRTDVCVAYIDDIVDKTQVQAVTDKIKSIDIDGIPLADKQLEEAIVGRGWNPYPLVRYSERPDTVASHLLEGRVVIFVDTSPSVIVLPTTFFDLCQHAEENRQTPFMGTYLRWVRFIGVFASMFLLPLWMLLVIHPELKPAALEFIGPQKMAKIPILGQFLIVELGVDLLRMAAVHTPTPLGSAMGLIAAILVGDIAVQTGLFVNEVVLYMAVASIGMFATPSYELGLANRIVRLALLLAVAAFQVQGFMIGTTLLIILLTTHRSYNSSYLWPFIPFNAKALGAIIVRQPVLSSKARPSFNKTRDNTRMPPVQENEK